MLPVASIWAQATACTGRAALDTKKAEEEAAKAALEEARQAADEVEARAREKSQAAQELRSEVEQLREQLASSDQSVQVPFCTAARKAVAACRCLIGAPPFIAGLWVAWKLGTASPRHHE